MDSHFEKDYHYHQIIAKEYDSIVVAPRLVTNNALYKKFGSLVKPGGAMLDLACGTGHLTFRFGKFFKKVVAVDHSDAMLDQAKKKSIEQGLKNVEFLKTDVFGYLETAEPSSFDLIGCIGFLHHLLPEQLPSVLKSLFRLLKPEGVLLVSEPIQSATHQPSMVSKWNRNSVAAKVDYSVHAEEPDEKPIEAEYLVNSLTGSGFKIEMTHRNWEIFPRQLPPTFFDVAAIRSLNALYGRSGNVFTLACKK